MGSDIKKEKDMMNDGTTGTKTKTKAKTMMLWIQSYQNHVIYCLVYVGIIIHCIQSISSNLLHHQEVVELEQKQQQQQEQRHHHQVLSSSWWWTLLSFSFIGTMILLLITTICLYFELEYVYKRLYLPLGDSGYPIVGHLLEVVQGAMEVFVKTKQMYGSPCVNNLLMNPVVMFSNDEDVSWVLSQERKGTIVADILPHWTTLVGREAIFCQHSTKHRRLRKIFEPAFSPKAIKDYVKLLDDMTIQVMDEWSSTSSEEVDYTIDNDSINDMAAMKNSSNNFNNNNKQQQQNKLSESNRWSILAMKLLFVSVFPKIIVTDEKRLTKLIVLFRKWFAGFVVPIPINVPGMTYHTALCAKRELTTMLEEMVHEFKMEYPATSVEAQTSLLGRLCYGTDDEGKALTEEQLITNIQFIIFAGHDSTKGSFGAFVHYLTEYPHVRTLLQEEVDNFSEPLDSTELKSAPILNAFLAEVWRLIPPLDCHNMTVAAKGGVRYKQYYLPRNVKVTFDIQAYNMMDDKRYPDPTSFRIERWLPKDHPLYDAKYAAEEGQGEEGEGEHQQQQGRRRNIIDYNVMSMKYRAFNAGIHMCLGAHFAKLESRIVLTRLLQRYTFQINDDTRRLKKFPFRQYLNDISVNKK